MKTRFELERGYSLVVGGHIHETPDAPGMVALQVMCQPDPIQTQGTNEPNGWVYLPESRVLGVYVKPSHVRAIASAMLAEATETKGVVR